MWVDKYKPKCTSEILGQSRNVARIKQWLKTFDATRSKPLFIYGPPGIGKTTAAHLCCKEAGYSTVEFNASDQRNKNIIKDVISTVVGNSRLNFFGRASETKDAVILDEIDGMAGNEDRGGIGQIMIELRHTKKPMIFICNDGQHQKLRSLKEKCEVIEFKRPEYDTIKALVNKIARDEKLQADKIDIKNLAESSDYDIRQILNSLYLFENGQSELSKTTRLNPFEATKKAFTAGKHTLESRYDCFFADYNIMPLFMFENYIKNKPAKGDQLKAISKAADSFCLSDLAEKEIRSNQNWSLLQTQGLMSTVIPSKIMQSFSPSPVGFPQFLGKLSNANKRLRLTQELNAHMCLTVRGGLDADYLEALSERLSAPLLRKDKLGGVDSVIDFMHDYALMREDLNSIMELASWSFKPDPMQKVDTKTKTALTNAYKKRSVALPYFVDDRPAKKRQPIGFDINDEEGEEEEEDDDGPVKLKPKKVIKKEKKPSKKDTEKEKEKNVEKDEEKTNGKAEKGAGKTTGKPAEKAAGKATGKTSGKAAEKDAGKAAEKDAEKPTEKTAEKKPPSNDISRYFGAAKKPRSSVSVLS
uniref:Replication factor C subunit 1 n=1 Tax=Aceria tosichella TaxID=561515 RepID=A0A6G1SHX0_9ACAR